VLDLAPVAAGTRAGQALEYTTELARRTEELGYRRFWVAEHHNMPSIASSAPAVLIAHLAASTSTIRVGSGGVMLPNHPPLVVAEQFGTLEALHPGRIDLGIGRAPGTDQVTALALRRTMEGLSAENFPQELADLAGLFTGTNLVTGEELRGPITATPGLGERPEIWLLGSSGFSAQLAGLLGLPFSFAHHFSAANTEPALALYRQNFRPSAWLDSPRAMVAVSAICADTDERAQWLSGPAALSFLRLRAGMPQPGDKQAELPDAVMPVPAGPRAPPQEQRDAARIRPGRGLRLIAAEPDITQERIRLADHGQVIIEHRPVPRTRRQPHRERPHPHPPDRRARQPQTTTSNEHHTHGHLSHHQPRVAPAQRHATPHRPGEKAHRSPRD